MDLQGLNTCASSSTPRDLQMYDVFVSFTSEDTRVNFTSHLYKALISQMIKIFIQYESLQMGEDISPSLKEAIQQSNISLIILTDNYASSPRCLDELVQILQCRETSRQIVLPVFYNIDPSNVRKQAKSCEAAFFINEERFKNDKHKLQAWGAALTVAASLCGWNLKDGHETEFIQAIVQDILAKRVPSNLNISISSLGYNLCHEYLSLFLQLGVDEVLLVGIAGESKMGKTVIAKAIFDGIFHNFDGCSFISCVGRKSQETHGLIQLQKQLLFDLLREDIKITNVTTGVAAIKERLCHKKILVILDDVDELFQLFALVGSRHWFGSGSKIIITTRILPLLHEFGVDQLFMAQGNPLPLDIQEIWEPFQQSCRKIVGLKEYIQSFSYLTNEKVKYLEECLIRERRKGAIQAQMISELQHGQGEEHASTCAIPEVGSSSRVCNAEVVDSVAADI